MKGNLDPIEGGENLCAHLEEDVVRGRGIEKWLDSAERRVWVFPAANQFNNFNGLISRAHLSPTRTPHQGKIWVNLGSRSGTGRLLWLLVGMGIAGTIDRLDALEICAGFPPFGGAFIGKYPSLIDFNCSAGRLASWVMVWFLGGR